MHYWMNNLGWFVYLMNLICPDKVFAKMPCYLSFSSLIVFSTTIHLSAKMCVSLLPSAGWSLKPFYPSECVSLSCLTTESWRTNPPPPQSEWAATSAPVSRTVWQQTPVLNPSPPSQRRRGTNRATRSYPYSQQRKVRPEDPGCTKSSILDQHTKKIEKYLLFL